MRVSKIILMMTVSSNITITPVFAYYKPLLGSLAVTQISTQETIIEEAKEMLARVHQTANRTHRMAQDAKKGNDLIKSLCLDDKHAQADSYRNIAQSRMDSLSNATTPDRMNDNFNALIMISERVQLLNQEASQCVGEKVYKSQETEISPDFEEQQDINPNSSNSSIPPTVKPAPQTVKTGSYAGNKAKDAANSSRGLSAATIPLASLAVSVALSLVTDVKKVKIIFKKPVPDVSPPTTSTSTTPATNTSTSTSTGSN